MKYSVIRSLLVAGIIASLLIPGAASGSPIPELDELIITNMQGNHIPGVSACAIWNGHIIWNGDYGYADVEQGLAVAESTLFMLASVSKTVTGCALMQLWEDGLFELDDDIDDYLPFEVNNPWHPDVPITFRMLLTHTSSIRDDRNVFDELTVPGDSPIPLGEFLEDYLTPGGLYYDPGQNYSTSTPGSDHEYCNVAIALVGYLVETITGVDFATYCRQHIFDALDMDDASWFLAPLDTARVARPYQWDGGTYSPYTHYGYPFYPAGQLRATASELGRFLMVFTEGGQGVLESETAELMTTVHHGSDQGLIWFRTDVGGHEAWYHTGGHYGVSTRVLVVPELRSGSVILTNGEASTNIIHLLIWNYVLSNPAGVGEGASEPIARLIPSVPNPFRSATTIRFETESSGPARLDVYDVAGRSVATLLDAVVPAGQHSIVFDAGDLVDGVYLFRFQSHRSVAFQKCVLLR
jgi:CubicO group peptidase (beta-lactamase class C family)